jgi:REP element-mobilizing transposase RayT
LLGLDQTVVYFITFCVKGRRPVLANDEAFAAFIEVARRVGNWTMIAAVLMPDHVHLLAAPNQRDAAVGMLPAAIKRAMRRHLRATWQWQAGCFDRLLRSDESADDKWNYIRDNPVRAGLVDHWSDWPYQIGFKL